VKNFFHFKPQDIRLILAVLFCAAFFIGTDTTEDKICAKHKYGNLVIQNNASDKRLDVELVAQSYEVQGLYNHHFQVDPGATLSVKDIRTGIYMSRLSILALNFEMVDFRSTMITINESKTTTITYP